MERTLQMLFRNQEERNVTVTVPDAREDLTAAEVEAVMNEIVARNIFRSSGGDLVAPVRAQVLSRQLDLLVEF
ncbi:MAG TPA: DUF2922 domain-containing protein [Bacillota bacterium]|nr:DUF2922 domain-containing protein [Bacillota bacterium]HOB86409.1 DUF2922 domain-containing protein [Bacillota bacterium]HOP68584.1 DUF2922 domain-containing protein [Bacillota bacterium]HPT33335.1 DUF2922 domain-containing protein [Bacillota bacterium]HPZ63990.1 DUF2922 domain-containing protein [Bacillota bacterium]